MNQIGVFLSYNHVDIQAAQEIRRVLMQISDRFSVFLDHASLQGGDEYESKIAGAIRESEWFLFLAIGDLSGKDMNWCFYEAGQFRAKLSSAPKANREQVSERMCVLFDGETLPRQTSQYQGIKISKADQTGKMIELDRNKAQFNEIQLESTVIYQLLRFMVQRSGQESLRDTGDPIVLGLLRESARAIIEAVLRLGKDQRLPEVSLQPRISFSIPAPLSSEGLVAIEDVTPVTGYDNALNEIFHIATTATTWGELRGAAKLPNDATPLWFEDLEKGVCKHVSLGKVPAQTDIMCVSGANMYRPVITRFVPYASGKRDVHIIFARVQRRPLIGNRPGIGDTAETIGMLLLSLIMAVRFRQRVLPLVEAIEAETTDNTAALIRIEREIGKIESEALEYGFAISGDPLEISHSNVVTALSDTNDRKAAKKFLDEYLPIRAEIMHAVQDVRDIRSPTIAADVQASIAEKLRKLRGLNAPFISLLLKELDRQQDRLIAND